jgi:hypothetical protein
MTASLRLNSKFAKSNQYLTTLLHSSALRFGLLHHTKAGTGVISFPHDNNINKNYTTLIIYFLCKLYATSSAITPIFVTVHVRMTRHVGLDHAKGSTQGYLKHENNVI